MSKDLTKLLKHSTDAIVSVEDSSGDPTVNQINAFPFVHLGLLADDELKATVGKNDVREAGGSNVQLSEDVEIKTSALELDPVEVDVLGNYEKAERSSLYLFGPEQSHKISNLGLTVEVNADLSAKGKKLVSTSHRKFKQSLADFDLGRSATYFNTHRAYQYLQAVKKIRRDNLVFEWLPYLGNFGEDIQGFEASKNRYVGNLYNSPAWGAAPDANYSILTFDGVNDYADFGDVLDMNATEDIIVEFWTKVNAADGATATILSKDTGGLGYFIYRETDNKVYFGNVGASFYVSSGSSLFTVGVWNQYSISINRSTNLAKVYANGLLVNSADISTITSLENSASFKVGHGGVTGYGNITLATLRVYNYGANGLPSNIATIISNHYNAEKAIFGL